MARTKKIKPAPGSIKVSAYASTSRVGSLVEVDFYIAPQELEHVDDEDREQFIEDKAYSWLVESGKLTFGYNYEETK